MIHNDGPQRRLLSARPKKPSRHSPPPPLGPPLRSNNKKSAMFVFGKLAGNCYCPFFSTGVLRFMSVRYGLNLNSLLTQHPSNAAGSRVPKTKAGD